MQVQNNLRSKITVEMKAISVHLSFTYVMLHVYLGFAAWMQVKSKQSWFQSRMDLSSVNDGDRKEG